jgi:hypothetical protein
MTIAKTLFLLFSVVLISNCGTTKTSSSTLTSSETTTESMSMANAKNDTEMISEGYSKGTIVASTIENDCPYTIRMEDKESYLLDPVNLEETYKKDGMQIWFKFTGLRMMNRCDKANPITITEIKKVN